MKTIIKTARILFFVFALHITLYTLHSYAAVPHLINYQARLTDAAGKPIDGLRKITFRVYDAATAGNLLWQGTYSSVTVTKGVFSVLLGDVSDSGFNFATLAFDKNYYLAIQVESEAEMSPRQMITSSGYAIKAEDAEKLGGKQPGDYVLGTDITSVPTANKALKLDANAKLPEGQGLLANNIVILTGTVTNGGTIPLPSGYTQAQCKWMVGFGKRSWSDDQHSSWFHIEVSANSNRVVTITGSGSQGDSYANYIIIGIK